MIRSLLFLGLALLSIFSGCFSAADKATARSCRLPSQPVSDLPKCQITSLPENQDPDLTGQPGVPDRTQGSGTR